MISSPIGNYGPFTALPVSRLPEKWRRAGLAAPHCRHRPCTVRFTAQCLSTTWAEAAVGARVAHPPAPFADRATQAGDAGAAGRAPRHHALPARSGGSEGRRGRQRRGQADPAELVDDGFSGQSRHPPPLPGARRRVPVRRRRRTCLRRIARADRRDPAGGVAQDHHPIDEAAHPSGRARQGAGPDHPGQQRQRYGRGPHAQAAAGRAGPVARPLARHKQSTGLFESGLGLPHRLRPTRRPEGADAATGHAQGRGLQADAVR